MNTQVTATVVNGVLKPDQALALADHTRVQLRIEPLVNKPDSVAAWQALKARLRERPIHGPGKGFTRDERHERR